MIVFFLRKASNLDTNKNEDIHKNKLPTIHDDTSTKYINTATLDPLDEFENSVRTYLFFSIQEIT